MDRQQDVPGSTTLICLWFNDFTNCQISCRISVKYLWSILCKLPCPGYFVTDKWSYDNSSLIQSVNLLGFHAFNWLWFVYINKIVRWKRVHALDNCQLSRWARVGMSEQVSMCQDIVQTAKKWGRQRNHQLETLILCSTLIITWTQLIY